MILPPLVFPGVCVIVCVGVCVCVCVCVCACRIDLITKIAHNFINHDPNLLSNVYIGEVLLQKNQ